MLYYPSDVPASGHPKYLTTFPETDSLRSMPKTNQERLQALRAKRDAAGWKRFEVWCHPMDWPMVKRYVERLRKRRKQS